MPVEESEEGRRRRRGFDHDAGNFSRQANLDAGNSGKRDLQLRILSYRLGRKRVGLQVVISSHRTNTSSAKTGHVTIGNAADTPIRRSSSSSEQARELNEIRAIQTQARGQRDKRVKESRNALRLSVSPPTQFVPRTCSLLLIVIASISITVSISKTTCVVKYVQPELSLSWVLFYEQSYPLTPDLCDAIYEQVGDPTASEAEICWTLLTQSIGGSGAYHLQSCVLSSLSNKYESAFTRVY
nr:hypothetical protein Iba_chr05aCG15730 [Ipomoea batatas]